jgi:hypothetical protein
MPQLNTVVLKDFAGADHQFNPVDLAKGIATLAEGSGVPVGDIRMSYGVAKTGTGRLKTTLRFAIPEVQTVSEGGGTKTSVLRTAYIDLSMTFEATSTVGERSDCISFVLNALQHSAMQKTFIGLESVY